MASATSSGVVTVQDHVFFSQLAAPRHGAGGALVKVDENLDFVPLHCGGRRAGIELQRRTVTNQHNLADLELDELWLKFGSGVADRAQDPPPVRIGAVDGCLHKRRASH